MKKTIALLLVLVLLCTLSVSAFADGGIDFIDPDEDDDIDPDGGDNPPSDNDDGDDDPAEPGPTGSDSTGELPEGSDPDGDQPASDLLNRLSAKLMNSMQRNTRFVNRRLLDVLSGPTLTVEGTSAKFDLKSGHIEKTLLRDTIKDLMDTRGIKDFTFTLNKVENRISAEDLLNKMLDPGVSSIKFVVDGDKLNIVGQKTTKQGIETVTVGTLQPSAAEDSPAPSAAEDSRAPSADAAKADTGKEEDADGNINVDEEGSKGANISDSDQKAAVSADDDDDTVDVNVTGGADDGKVTVKDNDVNVTGNTPDGSATSGSATIGSATSGSGSSSRSSSGGSSSSDVNMPDRKVTPGNGGTNTMPDRKVTPGNGGSAASDAAKADTGKREYGHRNIKADEGGWKAGAKNTVENVKPETRAAANTPDATTAAADTAKPDTDGSKTDINEQAFPHITIIENPDGSTTIVKPDISTENVTPDGNVVVNMDKL